MCSWEPMPQAWGVTLLPGLVDRPDAVVRHTSAA
jgi:hypothetical protein